MQITDFLLRTFLGVFQTGFLICLLQAVPDYYDHIKFPMDMKSMGERLKANYYVNRRLFIADMKRMITNCKVEMFFGLHYFYFDDLSRYYLLNLKMGNGDLEIFTRIDCIGWLIDLCIDWVTFLFGDGLIDWFIYILVFD